MQIPPKPSIFQSILLGIGIGLGLALIFFAGFFVRELVDPVSATRAATTSDGEGYTLLEEVQSLLDRHFLREQPDKTTRQYGAIRGMLATLNDRYTFFIDPPVAASESDVLAGTYGGIGVQVSRTPAGEFVLFPFEDSPASRAGIQNGDMLREINAQPIDTSAAQDSIDQMLRGEVKAGSGVEITVVHPDGTELTVFILFDVINVPSVIWRTLAENSAFGYVQILRFTSRTPEELTHALSELRRTGVSAIALDLRDNSGGLLQESIHVADEFLDSGVIVYQVEPSGETEYRASAGGALTDLPLVLLVNERTASGAELVAGALRDNERALLVGHRTYGKGTVQQIFALSDRSSLHVTSAEWFTPSRGALDTVGLEPDLVIEAAADGRDVQLGAAIEALNIQLNESVSS